MYEFLDALVQDVMSRPVSVPPETTLREAEKILEKNGFNAVPVVDAGERVIGYVTTLDLLKAFDFSEDSILPPFEQAMQRPVEGVMSRDPQPVAPREHLTRVLRKMVESRNKSFPVVEDGRLVGIVAREDLMYALRRSDAGKRP